MTLLAAGLRFFRLDAESLWLDELTQVATYHLPVSYIVGAAADTTQPPLDYWIGAGLDRLGLAGSDWWVRFPAAVFGVAGVGLLGWWTWRMAGAVPGITAAGLLAVCPLHLAMSQEARPYTIFVFLALMGVALFERAWDSNRIHAWVSFGAAFLCLLLSRWVEPHFITLGIVAYVILTWSAKRGKKPRASYEPLTTKNSESGGGGVQASAANPGNRIWCAFTTLAVAYAIYNPVFGIIFDRNRRAVQPQSIAWVERFFSNLLESSTAIVWGYSGRTLKPEHGFEWMVLLVIAMALTGLGVLIWKCMRRSPLVAIFILTIAAFPVLFGAVYARLTGTPSKPQYLLLLVAPLLAGVAIFADSLRRLVMAAGRRRAWVSFFIIGLLAGGPMLYGSMRSLTRIEKCDWRGALTMLRNRAQPGDAFASVASDTLPPTYHAVTPKMKRYFQPDSKFFWVDADAKMETLLQAPWTRTDQTVWVIGYNDRMYSGYDLLPTPGDSEDIRVHAFSGLFVLEIRGPKIAVEKLMDALAHLGKDLPERSSLIAPYLVRGNYLLLHSDATGAADAFDAARRQCRDASELTVLERDYVPNGTELARGTR